MNGPWSTEQLAWFAERIGRVVYLGISAKDDPRVHGHRYWFIEAAGRTAVSLRPCVTVGGAAVPGNTVVIVGYRAIVHSSDSRGSSDPAWRRRWDEGLSDPPAVPDSLPSWV